MLLAQSEINIVPSSQFSNLTNFSVGNLVSFAISFILIITAIILFFIIIGGGIAVIVSGGSGNREASQKGRNAITGAAIGLLIVFGAWAIMTLIENFFGVNLLQLNIP